jgi:hypothetical protein
MLAALVGLAFQALDIRSEAALQGKVDISIKRADLHTAMKAISKAAGVPVEAVNPIWDLKISMFCKAEPAGNMLASLASTLDCEWTKDGDTYRLRPYKNDEDGLDGYLPIEDRFLKKNIEDLLVSRAKGSPAVAVGTRPIPPGRDELPPKTDDLAAMLSSLTSSQLSGFWNGEPITWAPRIDQARDRSPVFDESRRIVLAYVPSIPLLEAPLQTPRSNWPPVFAPSAFPTLAEQPFARRFANWSSTPAPDDKRLDKSLQPADQAEGVRPALPTLADQAEAFFKGTGYPIVADEFSIADEESGSARNFGQNGGLLRRRWDGSVLAVRHVGFWRLRRFEIPNETIDRYARMSTAEPLSLDQYVSFAGQLTPAQLGAYRMNRPQTLPFDERPLMQMGPALTFLAKLSPAERQAAQGGLAAERLSPAQRLAFVQTMLLGSVKGPKPQCLGRAIRGDFTGIGVIVAEENDSDKDAKTGRTLVKGRRFQVLLGTMQDAVTFKSEASAVSLPR